MDALVVSVNHWGPWAMIAYAAIVIGMKSLELADGAIRQTRRTNQKAEIEKQLSPASREMSARSIAEIERGMPDPMTDLAKPLLLSAFLIGVGIAWMALR